jgi:hypothetical protein
MIQIIYYKTEEIRKGLIPIRKQAPVLDRNACLDIY